ncbi:MAG: multiubiquitin domain-containing protein [Haloarculaceae archaeon]
MTDDSDLSTDDVATIGAEEPDDEGVYRIYVDDAGYEFEDPYRTAADIMVTAGVDPEEVDEYLLYALAGDDRPKDETFEADDDVDLTAENRRFFAIDDRPDRLL